MEGTSRASRKSAETTGKNPKHAQADATPHQNKANQGGSSDKREVPGTNHGFQSTVHERTRPAVENSFASPSHMAFLASRAAEMKARAAEHHAASQIHHVANETSGAREKTPHTSSEKPRPSEYATNQMRHTANRMGVAERNTSHALPMKAGISEHAAHQKEHAANEMSGARGKTFQTPSMNARVPEHAVHQMKHAGKETSVAKEDSFRASSVNAKTSEHAGYQKEHAANQKEHAFNQTSVVKEKTSHTPYMRARVSELAANQMERTGNETSVAKERTSHAAWMKARFSQQAANQMEHTADETSVIKEKNLEDNVEGLSLAKPVTEAAVGSSTSPKQIKTYSRKNSLGRVDRVSKVKPTELRSDYAPMELKPDYPPMADHVDVGNGESLCPTAWVLRQITGDAHTVGDDEIDNTKGSFDTLGSVATQTIGQPKRDITSDPNRTIKKAATMNAADDTKQSLVKMSKVKDDSRVDPRVKDNTKASISIDTSGEAKKPTYTEVKTPTTSFGISNPDSYSYSSVVSAARTPHGDKSSRYNARRAVRRERTKKYGSASSDPFTDKGKSASEDEGVKVRDFATETESGGSSSSSSFSSTPRLFDSSTPGGKGGVSITRGTGQGTSQKPVAKWLAPVAKAHVRGQHWGTYNSKTARKQLKRRARPASNSAKWASSLRLKLKGLKIQQLDMKQLERVTRHFSRTLPVMYSKKSFQQRHPNHPFRFEQANLWCRNCLGRCAKCQSHCCAVHEADTEIKAGKNKDGALTEVMRLIRTSAMSQSRAGKDPITFVYCEECGKHVCPKCVSICPVEMCKANRCTACVPEKYRPCSWHAKP